MLMSHWRLAAVYGERKTDTTAHPTKTAMMRNSRLGCTASSPDLMERTTHAANAARRTRRIIRTGRWVVPPSISGAKIVRPPKTTSGLEARRDSLAGMWARHDIQQAQRGLHNAKARGRTDPSPILLIAYELAQDIVV